MRGEQSNINNHFPWQVLQIFSIYRLVIACTLAVYFVFEYRHVLFSYDLLPIITAYLIFAIICIVIGYQKKHEFNKVCIFQVLSDIVFLSVFLYLSPDLVNLYGILINATIAGGSIITAGRISLVFAAFASLSVLFTHALLGSNVAEMRYYMESGIWGSTFFATAILAFGLSQRVRRSEALTKQQSEAIAKLEKLSNLIIQRINSGIIVVDESERIQLINKAGWFLLGTPERAGPVLLGDVSPLIASRLQLWRADPHEGKEMHENLINNGLLVQFTSLNQGALTEKATLIFLEDSARAAEQAQESKLAALGRLTASIAHEIRNPLSAISHAAELLNETTTLDAQEKRLTEIVRVNANRMNEIIEHILQLTRRREATPLLFKARPWLDNLARELAFSERQNINIQVNVKPDDLVLFTDMAQLQQVMFNLCENGLRFSKEKNGHASLVIQAGITEQGMFPFIEVIDNGPGVNQSIEQYIFEPFFTTKTGGTGLGLYVARELCVANHIRIIYYSAEKGGACFRLTFPSMPGG
ncbi:MAG: HAMP domain-containing histidine kinase [Legionellales bacterium]|nr:HAMP domain-containing histidine kinase [Legionellales bacterium]